MVKISESIRHICRRIIIGAFRLINRICCSIILGIFRFIFPLNENMIIFESEGDFSDNSFALYDYMQRRGFFRKYKAVWLVSTPSYYRNRKDCIVCSKNVRPYNLRTIYCLAVAKYFFYDHCNILIPYGKRKDQVIFNLWHGAGFKGNSASDIKHDIVDFLSSLSDFWSEHLAKFCSTDISKTVVTGYPRNDYFFCPVAENVRKFAEKSGWTRFQKIIFWMPTFRKSTNSNLAEDYYRGDTGLPVIYSRADMAEFNDFLCSLNLYLVFKVHHLQMDYPIFSETFSNIAIVSDNQIQENGFQLYQLLSISDCLITDYLSVSVDYLLLDRPVIYTMDDYEEYKNSRGFLFDNVADYFAGHHVYNKKEFSAAIREIAEGKDPFKEARKKILPVMHKYTDGMSSRRVLECAGLTEQYSTTENRFSGA